MTSLDVMMAAKGLRGRRGVGARGGKGLRGGEWKGEREGRERGGKSKGKGSTWPGPTFSLVYVMPLF